MKEQFSNSSDQNELTSQSDSSNLEGEGDMFMPDGTNGGPEQPHEQKGESSERENSQDSSQNQGAPPNNGNSSNPFSDEEGTRIISQTESEIREELHKKRVHDFAEKVRNGEITAEEAAKEYITQFGDDEKRRQEDISSKRKEKDPGTALKEAYDAVISASDFSVAKEEFRNLRAHISFVYTDLERTNDFIDDTELTSEQKKQFKEWFNNAAAFFEKEEELHNNEDLEGLKNAATELYDKGGLHIYSSEIQKQIQERRGSEKKDNTQPQSLEDLIGLIVASEDPKWSTGREFELINADKEVQMHNFMEWVRSKIIYHHEFNGDSRIDLFSQIYIATPYRQIGLGEIIQESGRYFRKEVKDAETKNIRYEHSDEYQDFKDELLYEVWLFSKNHNYEVDYRNNMGTEEKAIETLMAIHFENIFSLNKDRLLRVMTLPSATKSEMDRILGKARDESGRILDKEREGGGVGRGLRQAELAYTYLYEIGTSDEELEGGRNMFEKALGERGSLAFYKGITEKLIRDKYGKELRETIKAYDKANKGKKVFQRDDFLKYVLESNPNFVNNINTNAAYDQSINIALDVDQLTNLNLMRELTERLMKKTYASGEDGIQELNVFGGFSNQRYKQDLLKEGMSKAIGVNYELSAQDSKYAEHWAFSMSYWTGLSARNDINASGFDGLSKLMNFNAYQIKQEQGKSGAGDLEFMNGIQKMVFTMWEGLRVKDERTGEEKTLLEVLQGGRGDEINLNRDISAFSFSSGSMQNMLAAQHYSNALNLYGFYMKERGFDFDKYLGRDNHGRLIVDHKLDELVRGKFLKGLRYTFDMGGYYYNRDVRGWRLGQDNKTVEVGTRKTEEFMFSEKILDMKNVMYARRGVDSIDKAFRVGDDGQDVLKNMSRNIAAWTFAMELWKHRRYGSTYKLYTASELSMIEQYLRSIPLEVEKTDMGAEMKTPFFTEGEFKKIRQVGKVESGRLEIESAAYSAFDSSKGAFWEMLKKFLEKTF